MTIDERTRHLMYLGLEETLGAEVADALMQHLPPVGWADVATKHDLDAHALLMKHDLEQMEERLGLRIDARLHEAQVRLMLWLFPTLMTSFALVFAVAKLA